MVLCVCMCLATLQVIVTKADLLSELDLRKGLEATMTEIMKPGRHACLPIVHVVSAKTNYGILPVMQAMAEIHGQKWSSEKQPSEGLHMPGDRRHTDGSETGSS